MSLHRSKTTTTRYTGEKSQSRSIENALFLDNEYKNGRFYNSLHFFFFFFSFKFKKIKTRYLTMIPSSLDKLKNWCVTKKTSARLKSLQNWNHIWISLKTWNSSRNLANRRLAFYWRLCANSEFKYSSFWRRIVNFTLFLRHQTDTKSRLVECIAKIGAILIADREFK